MAFVALGSNLGDRRAHLAQARAAMSLLSGTRLAAVGSIEETAPLGGMAQGPFLNQMVALETTLAPHTLLDALHRIERSLGRVRSTRWSARTIDLDIVRHGARTISSPTLVLPHPGIAHRDFWRRELAELTSMLDLAA
ncbi:MAG: 2-amino-4-hydroxy-6-hydroxymethyldihydropteridine diphosphokinase [bacterium]